MSTGYLSVKVQQVLGLKQSAVIETSVISTTQIISLARLVAPGQTLTIKSAYTITGEHLEEIAKAAAPGCVIFDFTR